MHSVLFLSAETHLKCSLIILTMCEATRSPKYRRNNTDNHKNLQIFIGNRSKCYYRTVQGCTQYTYTNINPKHVRNKTIIRFTYIESDFIQTCFCSLQSVFTWFKKVMIPLIKHAQCIYWWIDWLQWGVLWSKFNRAKLLLKLQLLQTWLSAFFVNFLLQALCMFP